MEIDNAEARLKPACMAKVSFTVEHKQNILIVLTNAIVDVGGKKGVFLAGEGNVAKFQAVELGMSDPKQIEVAGLSEGTRVITTGAAASSQGDRLSHAATAGQVARVAVVAAAPAAAAMAAGAKVHRPAPPPTDRTATRVVRSAVSAAQPQYAFLHHDTAPIEVQRRALGRWPSGLAAALERPGYIDAELHVILLGAISPNRLARGLRCRTSRNADGQRPRELHGRRARQEIEELIVRPLEQSAERRCRASSR